jgi:hypothetical protein
MSIADNAMFEEATIRGLAAGDGFDGTAGFDFGIVCLSA